MPPTSGSRSARSPPPPTSEVPAASAFAPAQSRSSAGRGRRWARVRWGGVRSPDLPILPAPTPGPIRRGRGPEASPTAPPLPRGTLPCPARAGSAEPGRKRQTPQRRRPPDSSRFRLTRGRLPTGPPHSPQGRRCRCRCCCCLLDTLPPPLSQPPPPPKPQLQHDRRPRRHHAPPSAHT